MLLDCDGFALKTFSSSKGLSFVSHFVTVAAILFAFNLAPGCPYWAPMSFLDFSHYLGPEKLHTTYEDPRCDAMKYGIQINSKWKQIRAVEIERGHIGFLNNPTCHSYFKTANFAAETFLNIARSFMGSLFENIEICGTRKVKRMPALLSRIPQDQLPHSMEEVRIGSLCRCVKLTLIRIFSITLYS